MQTTARPFLILQSLVQRYLDSRFEHRHPRMWERKLLILLAPVIRQIPINDKWNSFLFFEQWARAIHYPCRLTPVKRKKILLIAFHRNSFIETMKMAVLLAWRGHEVQYAYLPICTAPFKGSLNEDPLVLDWLEWVFERIQRLTHPNIRFISLGRYTSNLSQSDTRAIERQANLDSIISLRVENIDLDNEKHQAMVDAWIARGRLAYSAFRAYLNALSKIDIDIVSAGNGGWGISYHLKRVCEEYDIPFNSYDFTATYKSVGICHSDDIRGGKDINLIWENRSQLGYTRPDNLHRIKSIVDCFIEEKRTQLQPRMLQTVTQNAIATDIEDSFSILGLRPNTKYILVLTTNTYDAGYDERALTIYPSVEEWLIDTIQTLYDHSDFAIIIKLHPKFAKLGLLPSEHVSLRRWIEESPARNKRISVVTPNLPINSYQLMANAEFAATFSSTATMELPILGKFVAPLRHLYYSGKGFTVDSTDKESYRSNLKSLVARANIGALTQTDKAISNAYILFFIRYCSWSQPFIYRKPSDLVRYPLHELLRSENNDTLKRGNASMFVATDSLRSNFEFIIDVIDSLALNEAEFESQLFRFMAADRVLDLYEKMNPHSNST